MTDRFRIALVLLYLLPAPIAAFAQPATPPPQPPASPLTIRIGDADILPGGFVDALAIVRSTNVASGPATTFATIPFDNTPQGHLHETRLSAQTSRLNVLGTTKVGAATVKGFFEIDFLGNDAGNVFVYANSHTPRMRHAWVQYARGRIEFTAGQAWTMLVPNRNGLSPASADVFLTQNLDANIQLGLVWARQSQFRVVAHPSPTISVGASIENPQPFVGAAVVLPASFPAAEVDAGTTTGAPSPYPDVIGKIAFDPKTGNTRQHLEAAVLLRGFKTYSPAGDRTFSATGTGVSFSGVAEVIKNVRVVGTTLISDGGGRYMIGVAPDFVVNADGSMTTIGSNSFMTGVEAQVRPPTMIFGYYGAVRIDQEVADDAGRAIGYGVPGSTAANKAIDETTLGFSHAFFREPRYGSVQLIVQYSYVKRTPWSVPQGTPSSAHTNMVYTSVRYVLP
jgi:hypothetical protein